jgi:hypothetical protein
MEDEGSLTVFVEKHGEQDIPVNVRYHCQDGTALAGSEYTSVDGVLNFDIGVEKLGIKIPIIDNDEPNPDRTFLVVLSDIRLSNQSMTNIEWSNYNFKISVP